MIDIKHSQNGDIDLSAGDIQYTEGTVQHQRDLLLLYRGHLKESPAVGVGSMDFLHENSPSDFLRAVWRELSRDGMKVKNVKMENGELKITGHYENN